MPLGFLKPVILNLYGGTESRKFPYYLEIHWTLLIWKNWAWFLEDIYKYFICACNEPSTRPPRLNSCDRIDETRLRTTV